jgi:hypothetical protein
MLALATTRQGDVPLFCQALDGNASDKASLVSAVEALAAHLRAAAEGEEEPPLFVADSGLYSANNVARLSTAGVRWISRVPETSEQARAALQVADADWQQEATSSGPRPLRSPRGMVGGGAHRLKGGTDTGDAAPDAQSSLDQQLEKRPAWLTVQTQLVEHPKHHRPGRPRRDTRPDSTAWQMVGQIVGQMVGQMVATLAVDEAAVARAVRRPASFLVATNVLEPTQLSDQERIQTDKDQHSVERGFAFLKDPLFLGTSVFVKKPPRIVALALSTVLCLLVYRLAEYRLREQLAATDQPIPSQVKLPTNRPTMRWVFQCFEGVELLHIRHGPAPQSPCSSVCSPSTSRCSRSLARPTNDSIPSPSERVQGVVSSAEIRRQLVRRAAPAAETCQALTPETEPGTRWTHASRPRTRRRGPGEAKPAVVLVWQGHPNSKMSRSSLKHCCRGRRSASWEMRAWSCRHANRSVPAMD